MSDHNLELALAVGDITIASAHLEQGISDLLCAITGNQRSVNTLISGLSFDQLVQSCNSLLRQSESRPFIDRCLDAMKVAKAAWQERSRVVHARWARNSNNGHVYSFRERRWTTRIESLQWDMEDLIDVIRQINDASSQVGQCIQDCFQKPVDPEESDA